MPKRQNDYEAKVNVKCPFNDHCFSEGKWRGIFHFVRILYSDTHEQKTAVQKSPFSSSRLFRHSVATIQRIQWHQGVLLLLLISHSNKHLKYVPPPLQPQHLWMGRHRFLGWSGRKPWKNREKMDKNKQGRMMKALFVVPPMSPQFRSAMLC